MAARVVTLAFNGVEAVRVDVQVQFTHGEQKFFLVGMGDKALCAVIGPELKRRGLLFVGIDVIGNYLTEINVTSPTGLQQINRYDGVVLEAQIWDAIEARYQATRRTG